MAPAEQPVETPEQLREEIRRLRRGMDEAFVMLRETRVILGRRTVAYDAIVRIEEFVNHVLAGGPPASPR